MSELLTLFGMFFKMGAVTFGGGYAMLPILERELTVNRDWLTTDEILDYYAIGQSTPGIIAVNVATFVGYQRKGVLGGIVATAGIVSPSIIIISIIAAFLSNFTEILWVQSALKGINIAVCVLLLASLLKLLDKSLVDKTTWLIAIISFLAVAFFGVKTFMIIILSATLGIIMKKIGGKQ